MGFNTPIKKERIEKWDNLKALLILTIVIGHMADYYTKNSLDMRRLYFFIYIFHMPAFLFISGLFSKKNIDQKRYSNIFSYLLLFYVIKIFIFVTRRLANGEGNLHLLKEDASPWYAFALFAFCFITMLIKKLEKKYAMGIAILFGCLVGFDSWFRDFLVLSRIVVFYPFFLAGYFVDPKKLMDKLDKVYLKIIGLITFITLAAYVILRIDKLYKYRPLLTGRNAYSYLKIGEGHSAVYRLLYYGIVFALIFLLIAIIPKGKTFFTKWGKNSISIYAIHRCLIYIFFDAFGGKVILDKIYPAHPDWLIIPISLIITLILSPDFIAKGLQYIIKPKLANVVKE